jgi:peptide/nickel transport system substrate-binding protein
MTRWSASRYLAALLVTLLLAIAACGPAPSARQQETGVPTPANQTLVIIDRGEPASLAPRSLAPSAGVGLGGSQRVFNATLVLEDEMLLLQPYLADAVPQLNTESWRVFPDGRMETTYRLRPNLTWHDGAPLTTEDFLFAWQVYSTPAFGVATSGALGSMEDVLAPDERTVVVRWKRPYAEAAQDTISPLPRHILEQPFQQMDAQTFVNHPYWSNEYVGAGPYRLERREPGVSQDGVAFDAHALGRPKIDRIRILFVSDANAAIANLLARSAHYVTRFLLYYQEGTTLQEQWATRGGGGTVVWRPTLPRMWLIQHRPDYASPRELSDVRVRRALAHAIDAAALVEIMTGGHGVVSGTMTSPLAAYRPAVNQAMTVYPYDPRVVQQLLGEVGTVRGAGGAFTSPTGGPFTLELWHIEGATNARENALVAENLSRVGISAAPHVFSVTLSADNQARATAPGAVCAQRQQRRGAPARLRHSEHPDTGEPLAWGKPWGLGQRSVQPGVRCV